MLKKFFLLVGVFASLLFMSLTTDAAENDPNLTSEDAKIINIAEKYIYENDGLRRFDIESAQQNNESDTIIQIGIVINSMQDDFESQNLNKKEQLSRSAAFLIYGNYCGFGNRGKGKLPVDNLDTACMYHDYCYVHGGNNTTCNRNFRERLAPIMKNTNKLSYKYAVAAGAYLMFS